MATVPSEQLLRAPVRRRPAAFRAGMRRSATRTLISDATLSRRRGRLMYFAVLGLVTLAFTLAFVFPLYWMASGALKSPAEFAQTPPTVYPHTFEPESYADAWTEMDIAHYFFNTAFYAIGAWLFQIVFDVAVAYALSRLRPVLGNVVLAMMLASLMLPAAALLVPAYLTVVDVPIFHVNLLNTPWALWLPGVANAFNIYVLKRFFDQIPDELVDAAHLDGAGALRVLWHVVLPLSRSVLAVVSIFAVIGVWKDFLWPLLVLQDPESQTLSVALSRLAATARVPMTQLMAALAIASVPMIAIFLLFQRHILKGLSAGAVKG